MKMIAHRAFEDGVPVERFDDRRIAGFDGLELDLRLSAEGRLVVHHAPLFGAARARRCGESLEAALDMIGALQGRPQLMLLDVKCVTAAGATARLVLDRGMERDVLFACWHADEVEAIRAVLPGARVLFCVAPIVAPRAPRGRLENLYLANSFPFFWSAANFTPRIGKSNRHNINVKLISRRRGVAALPRAIDGLCVHRLFWTPSLAAIIAAEGLVAAVYGLRSQAHAQALATARGAFAYAIIGADAAARRATTTQSLRISA